MGRRRHDRCKQEEHEAEQKRPATPKRSASGPQTSCPTAIPTMKIVTTRGSSTASGTPSDAPISGSAGSMMSIDIAAIDINSAISAMNSRNGSGNRAAVASEVWVSGGCKCAYMDRIVRLAQRTTAPEGKLLRRR